LISHLGKLAQARSMLFLALAVNVLFWGWSRKVYPQWEGVPPPPDRRASAVMALSDTQFSYRFFALMLQNLGDVGRDVTPLKKYDYKRLSQWFLLLHGLDPASDHIPMIAAHYFGATRVPADAAEVVKYLSAVGQIPVGDKWRFLAHAAFLAQHRMNDTDLALKLAYRLTEMNQEGVSMPQWARQMPAFILAEKGDKAAAREFMSNMLVTGFAEHPEEINFMKSFLIDRIGMGAEEVESLGRMRNEGPGN